MAETIKEIYEKITILFNNIANSFIGSIIKKDTIKNMEYQLNYALITLYPYYQFNPKVEFNEINRNLSINLNPNFDTFPKISYKNYHTHNFIEKDYRDTYFMYPILECKNCQLLISSSGTLIDGNHSCDEFIIKKLLE